MKKFFVPTEGIDSWKDLLADKEKHWKSGNSAFELAHYWETAQGFPKEVAAVLDGAGVPALENLEILFGFPEYKVALPGGSRPSQTDLFVLARSWKTGGLISIAVEGKVSESFGPVVSKWLEDARDGRKERLDFLCTKLGLTQSDVLDLRYQLLHRTVSAILEAERIGAKTAVMLVHSFSETHDGFSDYKEFAKKLGCSSPINLGEIAKAPNVSGVDMYLGWITGC